MSNKSDIEEERKIGISTSFGCILVIVVFFFAIVIGIVFMYIESIATGGKEFLPN